MSNDNDVLRRLLLGWQPLERTTELHNAATGKPVPLTSPETEVWVNDLYLVQKTPMRHADPDMPPAWHLSIRNQDRSARHDWRDFQRIKNQLCGAEYWAYEVYPAESNKVDTANQYHLWAIPFDVGFNFSEHRVVSDHAVTSAAEPGAVQRDNEPIDGPVINDPAALRRWAKNPANNPMETP